MGALPGLEEAVAPSRVRGLKRAYSPRRSSRLSSHPHGCVD
ncbi:hypothetical protein HMPREF3039_02384 [Akkermansia sp. KLE1798]|nr:hypothetical protein HMPREF3039_02384 [Akkermansia sp. KLE1798]